MKKYFLYVAAALALGSCSSDEFLGENLPVTSGNEGAITFSGFKPNMHRATEKDGAAAKLLNYNFSVLGTKTVNSAVSNVFAHVGYDANGIADASLYDVWYGLTGGTTTTNPENWEYVGDATGKTTPTWADGATATFTPTAAQTIKYWDYAATQYDFVAYANTTNIPTGNITVVKANGTEFDGFNIKANATQLAGFYIADKKVMKKGQDYGLTTGAVQDKNVEFTFRAAGAKVRLGIYETIPGYDVRSITFRYTDGKSSTNAILDGSFVGTTTDEVDAVVTFETTAPYKAVVKVAASANKTNFDFGAFTIAGDATNGYKMGESSTSPTWTNVNYTNVIPNTVNVGKMTLYVDYVLENKISKETITVTGAKAVVPAEYMSWEPNHAYTYLFKITDETNGSTGVEGTDPAGLYPITFDACVETTIEDEKQGTTTTVAAYSITTYQGGSVVDAGVEYEAGTAIEIVVKKAADGSLLQLNNTNFKIYSGVADNVTEADLDTTAGLGSATELTTGVNISGTKATFTPSSGKYAVKVTDDNGKTYWKIIVVK